jgi:hypothetical protein
MNPDLISKKFLLLTALFAIFLMVPAFALADTGLIANYHFSEGSGSTTADATGVNNGILSGATWTTGIFGNALSYDSASNQFVAIPNSPSLNGIINSIVSVAAWVNTSSATSQVIFSTWDGTNGYQLWLNNGIPAIWSNGGGTLTASSSIADGKWHYVVGVWDGTNDYVYVDGVLRASGAGTFLSSSADNQIGTQCSGAVSTSCNLYFNGTIDEVRVYGRALSAIEVLNGFGYNVCPSGCEFDSIQSAVNNATSGTAIRVAPGTYSEQITINQNVTLAGAGNTTTIIQAPSSLSGNENLVTISGLGNSVEVYGFTMQGPATNLGSGISVQNGTLASIHNNQILNIADNPLTGAQHGWGIIVGASQNRVSNYQPYFPSSLSNGTATIYNNVISGYQKNGIIISNKASSGTIYNNNITGIGFTNALAQNGIVIENGAAASISNNAISNNWFNYTGYPGCVRTTSETIWNTCDMSAGILIYNTNNVTNSGNQIQNNQIGVYVSGIKNTVSNDKIFNGQYGVGIDGNNTIVIANSIFNNTHGIWITGNSSNITQNNITNNVGTSGVHLTKTSKNNNIYNNIFSNNVPQAVDFGTNNKWNSGTISSGTGNVWTDYYKNPGNSSGRYYINQSIGAIDYHPIIPLTISQTTVRYNYLRENQAQYVDIYVSDPYGVSQGNVIVQDNSTATHTLTNYTANVLTFNKYFRAVFSAQGIGNHTLRIYVTDNIGFFDFTKTAKFYVEPSTAPVPTLNVNPSTVHSGTVTFKLTFDRLMDTSRTLSATIRGSSGGTAVISGSWISSTVWQGTYTVAASMKNGVYTLTANGARDLTAHAMNAFYQAAFTKN